jgi:hypothetical protein
LKTDTFGFCKKTRRLIETRGRRFSKKVKTNLPAHFGASRRVVSEKFNLIMSAVVWIAGTLARSVIIDLNSLSPSRNIIEFGLPFTKFCFNILLEKGPIRQFSTLGDLANLAISSEVQSLTHTTNFSELHFSLLIR